MASDQPPAPTTTGGDSSASLSSSSSSFQEQERPPSRPEIASPTVAVSKHDTLLALFKLGATWVKTHHKGSKVPNDTLLKMYGLYKRVMFGACNTKQPNLLDPRGRARYFSWKNASQFSEEQATFYYLDLVRYNFPEFARAYKDELKTIEESRNMKDEYNMLLVHSSALLQMVTDMAGKSLVKRGDLYVSQVGDVGLGYNRHWQLRFIVLDGSTLFVYETRGAPSPTKTYELTGCELIMEPPQAGGKYYIMSIMSLGQDQELVVRLSTESEVDSREWGDAINRSCVLGQYSATTGATTQEPLEKQDSSQSMELRLRRQVSQGVIAMTAVSKESAGPQVAEQGRTKKLDLASRTQSRPVHREVKHSLLSAESQVQNYNGFVNLFVLIVVCANSQLLLGKLRSGLNVSKITGLLRPEEWPLLLCLFTLWVYFMIALGIEKLAYSGRVAQGLVSVMRYLNSASSLLIPAIIAWRFPENTMAAVVLMFVDVITFLKVVSFHAVNADLRRIYSSRNLQDDNAKPVDGSDQGYPGNLNLGNIWYFIMAPTLCYQPSYPRTPRIRRRVVMSLLVQILVVGAVQMLVIDNMHHTIMSTLEYVRDKLLALGPLKGFQRYIFYKVHVVDLYTLENLLHLAIPCTFVWLLSFYIYFHLWLNLMAELCRFGDREFYKDWWNSTTLSKYWRTWNMPVHAWVVRHIYFPCLKLGLTPFWSSMVVFLFSAVFHEWIVAIPIHAWKGYAFFAMAFQVPLIFLMDWVDLKFMQPWEMRRAGNSFFWLVFCIFGQPLTVLLIYWHIYVQREGLTQIIYPS